MSSLFGPTTDPPLPTPVAIGYAQVALEQNIDASADGLTYLIPESMGGLEAGERVVVPLGRGNNPVPGYVVQITNDKPAGLPERAKIKPILRRDPKGVSLTPDLVQLGRWLSRYYCCPLGMVLVTMLPAAVKRGTGTVSVRLVDLARTKTDTGEEKKTKLSGLQKSVIQTVKTLAEQGELPVEVRRLADLAGAKSISPVNALIDKGLLTLLQQDQVRAAQDPLDWPTAGAQEKAKKLTADQQAAVEHFAEHHGQGFSVHLLHGVTGSGKTEVYLRAIEQIHRPGDPDSPGAIILVPEISLTPQTVARFITRFEDVAVLHSGLTAAQRHEQWQNIRSGRAKIVIGARSAIFAPMTKVGIIIVDEEHDGSYKQDQLPRYHGRDVAIKRAQLLGVPIVLGSATPSLESYHHATDTTTGVAKKYHLVSLPKRVGNVPMPPVKVVDMTHEPRVRGRTPQFSGVLQRAMTSTIGAGGQAILLLNRRGYANYIGCPDQKCGWMLQCDSCDANMVYHKDAQLRTGGQVRCHHCHAEQLLPRCCPMCTKNVMVLGVGTQKIHELLGQFMPDARLLRMDADTMRNARDYQQGLDAFAQGQVDILVGTQMIAKGLDFPNVRLVGVINADTALHIPDFRAAERTFGLIAQVAGRAGRTKELPAQVIVQTFSPQDLAITLAAKHDYEGFAKQELEIRKDFKLPPYARMARIVVRDRELPKCQSMANRLANNLNQFSTKLSKPVQIGPPLPCPISRISDHHRIQIELTSAEANPLQQLMTELRNSRLLRSDSHTAIDVDPIAFL